MNGKIKDKETESSFMSKAKVKGKLGVRNWKMADRYKKFCKRRKERKEGKGEE